MHKMMNKIDKNDDIKFNESDVSNDCNCVILNKQIGK